MVTGGERITEGSEDERVLVNQSEGKSERSKTDPVGVRVDVRGALKRVLRE